ncbi:RNA methyltransferase [Microvirga makkahensis]|uniref:tRNA (cytidine/uridine-2'-O-)-methyltransferase TrmJ n=1 Tax=Microvirga makkahensis TaxID=1128670 RepID=A0A7X3MN11_9HYPH|nr:RNA methyltransferase [Microvirga makkahensis]MXQ09998.1 TrmJ/YjtD family RNA methyltransferase [Microvirga makkahensis]
MIRPIIILVEPQLAENIGMVARAMANFGLSELRIVAPRDGWPRKGAHSAASGAVHVLEEARLYDTARDAIADLNFVFATTARERGQMKRVFGPGEAMSETHRRGAQGQRIGILFGRERTGLENDEVSLADAIITFPVDRQFSSLNLAQAVLLVSYEWYKLATGGALPFSGERLSPPAPREMVTSFFDYLEAELDAVNFYPEDKRPTMTRNMRDIFHRLEMTEQDVRTLRGAIRALAEGRRLRKP